MKLIAASRAGCPTLDPIIWYRGGAEAAAVRAPRARVEGRHRHICIYGLLGTGVTPLPVLEMIAKVATIKAHNMSLTSGDETRRKAAIEFVTKGLQVGTLKPVIDCTFSFDEIADVHRYLEQSGQFGKIVVTV